MPSDFSNRIGARMVNVGLGNRPSPEDIDDLRRRQQEHAKRTRAAPKKDFAAYLERDDESPHEGAQEGEESPDAQQATMPKAQGPQKKRWIKA